MRYFGGRTHFNGENATGCHYFTRLQRPYHFGPEVSFVSTPCPGCKACLEGKIPDFSGEDEEEAFWDGHSPSQFQLRPAIVRLRGRPRLPQCKQRITLMLNAQLKEHLVELAEKRGIGYQTLIQDFLIDRVTQELKHSG